LKDLKNIIVVIVSIVICIFLVELTSYLILKYNSRLHFEKPYFSREICPYYVFKNTPGYTSKSIKKNDSEKDIVIDSYGFISNCDLSKPKGVKTFRIFLTGGSAAYGNGQSDPYERVKKYAGGVYSFESSIAGQIELILNNTYPEFHFEVVNACASGRQIHQSIGLYLSVIKDLSPDVVISMDGMNDLATINGISPYSDIPVDVFSKYLELYQINENFQEKSFSQMINLIKAIHFSNVTNKLMTHEKSKQDRLMNYDRKNYTAIKYREYKNEMSAHCNVFTDLILYYHTLCQLKDVTFIFCLQPLLNREINKVLTPTEQRLQQLVNPINISLGVSNIPDSTIIRYEEMGNYTLKFFIDDYLSKEIDTLSGDYGFEYIDFNRAIENKYAESDFYTDYCHLTFEANKIIAEILSERIGMVLFRNKNELTPDK